MITVYGVMLVTSHYFASRVSSFPTPMLKRKLVTPLFTVLLCVSLLSGQGTQHADPQLYAADVRTLAAPNMEGRGAGTKGLQRARDYIVKRFTVLKLKPAGDHGSYLQPFTVTTGAELKGANSLKSGTAAYKLHKDFIPFSFSSVGEAEAPVVFAG